jgi:hypothetical protein
LYSLDAVTGVIDWSWLTAGAIDSSPRVANGMVYVGSDDGRVYAFEALTIPEPATLVLFGFGLLGLGFSRREHTHRSGAVT